jgi:hypothetical protein
MSESLRDSAISLVNEALELMEIDHNREVLKALEKAEEAAGKAEENDIFLYIQTLNREELKKMLEDTGNKETIKTFSPLMHKYIQNLEEITFDEIKKKCCSILIPAE